MTCLKLTFLTCYNPTHAEHWSKSSFRASPRTDGLQPVSIGRDVTLHDKSLRFATTPRNSLLMCVNKTPGGVKSVSPAATTTAKASLTLVLLMKGFCCVAPMLSPDVWGVKTLISVKAFNRASLCLTHRWNPFSQTVVPATARLTF